MHILKTTINSPQDNVNTRLRARQADTLSDLLLLHRKWLYIEGDDVEFIEVALAAALDREIPGDPVWMFLVAPSGALKTEIIRSLNQYHRSYSLDTLTPNTLISGKAEKNKTTGQYEPIAGILRQLDGRCLLIKDFTTILSSSDETRTARARTAFLGNERAVEMLWLWIMSLEEVDAAYGRSESRARAHYFMSRGNHWVLLFLFLF